MKLTIATFTLLLASHFSSASTGTSCSQLLKSKGKPGYKDGKEIRRKPILDVAPMWNSNKNIRLHHLVNAGEWISHPSIIERTIKTLQSNRYDAELGPKDSLLMFHIVNDKDSFFRRLIEGLILSETLDIIGIEAHSIGYALTGPPRLIVIIKDKMTDYRESPQTKINTHLEAVDWIENQVSATLEDLFSPTIFDALDSSSAQQVYKALAKRNKLPEGHPRQWMPMSLFRQSFDTSLAKFIGTLDNLDLIHLRPSFWSDSPQPDRAALKLFHYLNQRNSESLEDFKSQFTTHALMLRQKLYDLIHKTSSGSKTMRGGGGNDYVATEHMAPYAGKGNGVHALSGVTHQEVFGSDFFRSGPHENMSLESVKEGAPEHEAPILSKLQNAGFIDVSELSFIDVETLLNGPASLSIGELTVLAQMLTEHSVYMSYPPSVLRKLPPEIRLEVRPPRNRNFNYDPLSRTYTRRPREDK